MKKNRIARGRRVGKPDTNATILRAAMRAFSVVGYDAASVRAIARDAGVDSSLVHHYFGTKRRLFEAATSDAGGSGTPRASAIGSAEKPGETLVRGFLDRWDAAGLGSTLETLLRAAASDADAERRLVALLHGEVVEPAVRYLADRRTMTKLRAALVTAQLVGLAWERYVFRTEPTASASSRLVARVYGPSLTATLQGLDFPPR